MSLIGKFISEMQYNIFSQTREEKRRGCPKTEIQSAQAYQQDDRFSQEKGQILSMNPSITVNLYIYCLEDSVKQGGPGSLVPEVLTYLSLR